jgi:hypothetical protein
MPNDVAAVVALLFGYLDGDEHAPEDHGVDGALAMTSPRSRSVG